MHDLDLIDRDLYFEVRRRQAALWDALIGAVVDAITGVRDAQWGSEPGLTAEDLDVDLQYGQS